MKNLYLLGGIVVIVLIGLGAWFLNQSSTSAVPAGQNATTTAVTGTQTTPVTSTPSGTTKTPVTKKPPTGTTTTSAAPAIAAFSPASASVGSTVTIMGSGFDASQNAILFGTSGDRHHPDGSPDNQIAVVGSPDGKTLTFTVPSSGPSGLLCDANTHCVGISAIRITPGQYPVVVSNRNGKSKSALLTVTAQ